MLPPNDDAGGVHTNSGIPNHAAYLMATGMDGFSNGNTLLDGREVLGELTFDILNNYLLPTSDFQDARDSYIAAAEAYAVAAEFNLVDSEAFVDIIKGAWEAVGLPEDTYTLTRIKAVYPNLVNHSHAPAFIDDFYREALFYVPYGTDMSALAAIIVTSENAVASPVTPPDFSNDFVQYTVSNAVYSSNWLVGAIEEPILQYSGTVFTEGSTNTGTISNSISVTLINDIFAANVGTNLITTGQVTASGVPAGLTVSVITGVDATGNNTASITLSGSAAAHANANDLSNLTIRFNNIAFYSFYAYQVTNSTQAISVNFDDPVVSSGGGGGGFFPTPPPVDEIITTDNGPEYTPSDEDTETVTGENGTTVKKVTLSEDTIDELLKQLGTEGSPQQITIKVNDGGNAAQLQISASGILKLAASAPNANIIVSSGVANYELPVGLLDLEALAAELNGTTETLNINIILEKIGGKVHSSFTQSVSQLGASALSQPIDFRITAESNGSSKEINHFGKTYVSRSITLGGTISPFNASVVVFNPATSRLSFVPATFKTVDGQTIVTFKRNSNSIYAVVSTKKVFFNDVQKHWASTDIEFLASRMIINGYNESTFKPDDQITRAQFLTMLVQALGLSSNDDVSFNDIPADAWYKGYVGAAVEAGITSGIGDNQFMPNALITREQMAVMISNALTFVGKDNVDVQTDELLEQFADREEISDWARSSVALAYEKGIVRGMDPVTFAPLNKATRAQAAVMIRGLLTSVNFVN